MWWRCLPLLALAGASSSPPPHPVSSRRLQELTPCQVCCQPGGKCDEAFKQTPGQCCGQVDGSSYCCPSPGTCVMCNYGYKCARAGSRVSQADRSRICEDHGGAPTSRNGPSHHEREERNPFGGGQIIGSIICTRSCLEAIWKARGRSHTHPRLRAPPPPHTPERSIDHARHHCLWHLQVLPGSTTEAPAEHGDGQWTPTAVRCSWLWPELRPSLRSRLRRRRWMCVRACLHATTPAPPQPDG